MLQDLLICGCGWFFNDDVALLDYISLPKAFIHLYWRLKGYSDVNLIHGLNHRETVLDSREIKLADR